MSQNRTRKIKNKNYFRLDAHNILPKMLSVYQKVRTVASE